MELKQSFGVDQLLDHRTAEEIYQQCSSMLQQKAFSTLSLLKKWKVEVVCTTDDPADDLQYHKQIRDNIDSVNVHPTWRPDKALAIADTENFNNYLETLGEAAAVTIRSYQDLLDALRKRQDYFDSLGCKSSDHGIETFYFPDFTQQEITGIFDKARAGKAVTPEEAKKYQTALLLELARMNYEKGWAQQFHYGAMRNNNSVMYKKLGKDTGFDSIGDKPVAEAMARFFDTLNTEGKLTRTIIYNLNPNDNAVVASMLGNFQDGLTPGKMQMGSAWWFNDNVDGIEDQLNTLSNMGLLSRFVGMLTDSRSFLSYSRHDYFRRILANLIGSEMEKGLIAEDYDLAGEMIRNISYHNAKSFFGF